jgi:glycosyltransferase involved in cell wall biosynthesis
MKKVDIVVPAYNDADDIKKNIPKLSSFCKEKLKDYNYKILILENGSKDNTEKIVLDFKKHDTRVNYTHLKKVGRGNELINAWSRSDADYLCYMDIDLSTDIKSLPILIKKLENGYDICVGSKYLNRSKKERTFIRLILSRVYNTITGIYLGTTFTDAQCGFKAINKTVAKNVLPLIRDKNWFFDTELLYFSEKMGYRRAEIPIVWVEYGNSSVKIFKTIFDFLKKLRELKKRKIL